MVIFHSYVGLPEGNYHKKIKTVVPGSEILTQTALDGPHRSFKSTVWTTPTGTRGGSWESPWARSDPSVCSQSESVGNPIRLVVSTPLKNISQLGFLLPTYGKIKHVPNHQPAIVLLNNNPWKPVCIMIISTHVFCQLHIAEKAMLTYRICAVSGTWCQSARWFIPIWRCPKS